MCRSRDVNKVYGIITLRISIKPPSWLFHVRKKKNKAHPEQITGHQFLVWNHLFCDGGDKTSVLARLHRECWPSGTEFESQPPGCHSLFYTSLFICLPEAGEKSHGARPAAARLLCMTLWRVTWPLCAPSWLASHTAWPLWLCPCATRSPLRRLLESCVIISAVAKLSTGLFVLKVAYQWTLPYNWPGFAEKHFFWGGGVQGLKKCWFGLGLMFESVLEWSAFLILQQHCYKPNVTKTAAVVHKVYSSTQH